MPTLLDPAELVARVRRDVDRSLLRAKNGIKIVAGSDRPGVGLTPKDTVWRRDKAQLWRYRSENRTYATPVVIVMSLVSRSYILDLRPGNSFVEYLLGRGFDVFLVDWGIPDELEAGNTLETYCDEYLPRAVAAASDVAGVEGVTVYGYCFGGLLSLLYGAGHPGLPIRNLGVMATPIDFRRMGPMAALLQEGRVDPETLIDETGNVPPDAIANSFKVLKPTGDLTTYANLWENLWNDQYLEGYQAMTQWTRDHIPFPGACFRQTADLLSRKNQLATGKVDLGDRVVDLADITCPFLNVVAENDHIVPVDAVGPLTDLVGSQDKTELRLRAGHVGLVVGRSAAKNTLPAIAGWLAERSERR